MPLAVFPERLAQGPFENLAGSGQRQRIFADIDAARAFVASDQRLAEFDQLAGRHLRTASGYDHGVNRLTPAFVGDTDDGALGYGRVLGEGVFDLDRIDVLAAGDDHVFDPIDDIDESVLIHVAAVAGMHPAVDHGAGGLFGALPITHHDIVATHDDFTDRAMGYRLVVRVDDANLATQRGAASASVAAL